MSNKVYCTPNELSTLTGLSLRCLKQYRANGLLVEGIHWQRINARVVLFNLPLVMDWIANRSNPMAHQRAIDAYLASLLSTVTTESEKTTKRGKVA